MIAPEKRCQSLNAAGEPCGQPAQLGTKLCLFHDPGRQDQRKAATALGLERAREAQRDAAARRAVEVHDDPPPLELELPALLRRLAWIHQRLAGGQLEADQARELRSNIREMRLMIRDRDIEDRLRQALAEIKELRRHQGPRRTA